MSTAEDQFDYGDDAALDPEAVARAFVELDQLTRVAERASEARKKAEDIFLKLKKSEERLLTRDIPELLARLRLDKCTTSSGIEVSLKREIKASMPGHERVEDRQGALRWLVDQGHASVIKNIVTVELDRGKDGPANELLVELRGRGFDAEQKKDVNPQTLSALVRRLMDEGKIIPRGLLNLFDCRVAKLTRHD